MRNTYLKNEKKVVKNNLSLKDYLFYLLKRSKGIPIITDLRKYNKLSSKMRYSNLSELSDTQLRNKANDIRDSIQKGEDSSRDLPKLFALISEACCRTIGLNPFDEQVICAIALSEGNIVQMNTGEGKTLAAVFAASYKAMNGNGIHILTANEYLAKRDATSMAPVYRALGLTVDFVEDSMSPDRRRAAYNADITYLTVRQSGFDYLSDSLTWQIENRVQRPFNFCLVDEADLIMIDEARIPLVIAGIDRGFRPDPNLIKSIIPEILYQIDFTEDQAKRNCNLTLNGQKKVAQLLNCGDIHDPEAANWYAAVHVALHAEYQLHRDIDYIVRNGSIELVDEFTGRVADGRKWPDGIQGALEAKEGLNIQQEGRIYSSITVHGLLNLYPEKSGMTATAVPAAGEFNKTYNLKTIVIPPHVTSRFVELPDRIYASHSEKLKAIQEEVQKIFSTGRPILIGTASIQESEEIAYLLGQSNIKCQILNAKNDEQEAGLIAKAGMWGAVTISTNMAGRGTDIKLGGSEGVLYNEIVELGGLYIIGTTRFDSKRIDNQLRGRAARLGDPGVCRFFISLQDPLIQNYGILDFFPKKLLEGNQIGKIENKWIAKEIARTQEIIEDQHASMRRTLAKYSELLELQRKQLFSLREKIVHSLSSREGFQLEVFPEEIRSDLESMILRLENTYGKKKTGQLINRLLLQEIDQFWSDQLSSASEKREGIHLVRYAGKVPLYVYINEMVELFDLGITLIFNNLATHLISLSKAEHNEGKLPESPTGPSSTWTYHLNDNPFSFDHVTSLAGITNATIAMIKKTFQVILISPLLWIGKLLIKVIKKGFLFFEKVEPT